MLLYHKKSVHSKMPQNRVEWQIKRWILTIREEERQVLRQAMKSSEHK